MPPVLIWTVKTVLLVSNSVDGHYTTGFGRFKLLVQGKYPNIPNAGKAK